VPCGDSRISFSAATSPCRTRSLSDLPIKVVEEAGAGRRAGRASLQVERRGLESDCAAALTAGTEVEARGRGL
jgi:hypothetical protein